MLSCADVDPAVADLEVERALALDAGEIVDPDRLTSPWASLSLRNGFGGGIEGAEGACRCRAAPRRAPAIRAPAPRCSGVSIGP